jgi:putative CocE/NonD family hydrolase
VTWEQVAILDNIEDIDASGVAVYHLVGWFDIYTTQQAMAYATLSSTPQKMMIGPWTHSGGSGGRINLAEFHRWHDYWLKGIDNGIMDDASIHYYPMNDNNTLPDDLRQEKSLNEMQAEDASRWRATDQWPPPGIGMTKYFLAAGPSDSVDSVNDGGLVMERPTNAVGRDEYTVDYTSATGSFNRWRNGYGARRAEPEGTTFFDERTPKNEKALTYTTTPLTEDLVLLGYPVIHLWASSTHADGDFFAYLEEVDAEGNSHYVTEGALRASIVEEGGKRTSTVRTRRHDHR